MFIASSIEDVLSDADASGFYNDYAKNVRELHKKTSWPGKIRRDWCIAAGLQHILLEKHKMLIPPHKLQADFKIDCTQTIRSAKSKITDLQGKMGLKPRKDVDYVTCYINFAEAYLTRKPYEVLPRTFDEARENYTKRKEFYENECGDAPYRIAAMCLLDAGLTGQMVSKIFGIEKSRIQQWGYTI